MSGRRQTMPWVRVATSLLGVLLAYYTMPVRWTGDSQGVALLGTIGGVALLAWAMAGQLRRHFAGDESVSLPTLLILVLLVMAVFAYGYYALETANPGQMADLETRTDSLYFTLQVLSTVGLGDVHAVGQTARVLVTVQMVFDLIFIAAAGSVIATSVRSRLREPQASTRGADPAEES